MPEPNNDSVAASPAASTTDAKRGEQFGFFFTIAIFLSVTAIAGIRLFGLSQPSASPSPLRKAAPAPVRASVTIDPGKKRQRLEGFGASTAFYQNWIVAHPHKYELYDALFKGLDLDILRLQNVFRPEKGADFARDDRDIVRGAEAALGRPIPLMMSSWSPPAALKSNGSEKDGGTLARVSGKYNYGGFGAYWRDSLLAYRKIGIVPTYISIQNEPDWKAEWETCLFRPTEDAQYAGYDRAFDAVYSSLRTMSDPPKMLGPETLGIGDNRPESFLPSADTERMRKIYGVAHHLYHGGRHEEPDSFIPRMQAIRQAYPDKPRFQTEFGRSDGFETAWVIHNSLVEEEVTAYIYWAAIWPGEDCLITIDNPWNKEAWRHPNGYRLNDRYYALKHYSYFIGPGYRRVDAACGENTLKVSAYVSPDNTRLVAVLLNTSSTNSVELTVKFDGFAPDGERTLYRTCGTTGEKFLRLNVSPVETPVALPPRSIVTMVVEGGNRK